MLQELIIFYGLYYANFYSSVVNFLLMSFYLVYLAVDSYLISIINSDSFVSTSMDMDDENDLYKTYPYEDYLKAYNKSLFYSFVYLKSMYFLTKNLFVHFDNIIKNSPTIKYTYCNLDYILVITYEDLFNLRIFKLAYSKIKTFIMVKSIKYLMNNPKTITMIRNMMKNVTHNTDKNTDKNTKDRIINVNTSLLNEHDKTK